ncbi:priA protein [Pseudohyphozyma bogoriensis]|nr:priA protein [Pseudohyphozyma bogoriensis]
MLPGSLTVVLATFLLAGSSSAIGDFPCSGSTDSQSCALWSTSADRQFDISANATCTPDPINPTVSYCGYANSPCSNDAECDYGSCGSNGICQGYLGYPCPNGNTDCQAFFFCGTDGTCGGVGAACANGDSSSPIPTPDNQCVSNSCDTTTKTCDAPPTAGMATGSGCNVDDVCSGTCLNSTTSLGGYLCTVKAAVPSGRFRSKRAAALDCPEDHTACLVGSGLTDAYECVDTSSNLEQCGGCVGTEDGTGTDCTSIPGAESQGFPEPQPYGGGYSAGYGPPPGPPPQQYNQGYQPNYGGGGGYNQGGGGYGAPPPQFPHPGHHQQYAPPPGMPNVPQYQQPSGPPAMSYNDPNISRNYGPPQYQGGQFAVHTQAQGAAGQFQYSNCSGKRKAVSPFLEAEEARRGDGAGS